MLRGASPLPLDGPDRGSPEQVLALLAVIADPAAAKARLDELMAAAADARSGLAALAERGNAIDLRDREVREARARLDAEQADHAAAAAGLAAATAAFEAAKAAFEAREAQVSQAQGDRLRQINEAGKLLAAREQAFAEQSAATEARLAAREAAAAEAEARARALLADYDAARHAALKQLAGDAAPVDPAPADATQPHTGEAGPVEADTVAGGA